jgi:hypothetical protein
MAIVQKIKFYSPNKYFAGFLQNLIDESQIKASVEFENGIITLILDPQSKEALDKFSKLSQKYLPQSIFLGEIETFEDPNTKPKETKFKSPPYKIAPCPICLEELTDPKSPRYLDDTITCTHYSNTQTFIDNDPTIFSPHFNENDTILLCDTSKLDQLFYISENEIKALFSIEKPSLTLTLKDEELKNITGKNFMRVKAPYNIRSALVALNARESQIDTLFFDEREDEPRVVVVQDYICMIYDNRVSKKLEDLDSNLVLNRFKNIQKEASLKEAIGANLSQRGISFIVSNENGTKEVIKFKEFNLKKTLEEMENDEIRKKLLKNFSNKFPETFQKLQTQKLNLFETISVILDLEKIGFEELSTKALEFRGNGGLKIDMNFKDGDFDYSGMIGSIMSFKLAQTQTHYLAYSIFEAYGDMAISILTQLKQKFKIDQFIMQGDMFGNGVLFSRILSKFLVSKPYFSKDIALDSKS